MNIWEAIVQGFIQGVTEFLPVSSSGHLSLFQHFTGQSGETGFLFSLTLHAGTLIAVALAFYKLIWDLLKEFGTMLKEIFTFKFTVKNRNPQRNMILMIFVTFIPLLFFYIVLGDFYQSTLSDNDIIIEGLSFLLTATLLFFACRMSNGTKTQGQITPKDAMLVGILQGVAPLPGVSRSGATISSGLMCGFSKETAVQFSFIMGIPAILGGTVVELSEITPADLTIPVHLLIIGVITSAIIGFLSIKMVQWLLKENKFKIFAYYTLIIGVAVVGIGIFETLF